ncbi:MAG: MotA/TolQ/ExbB proton channel family protein [bacterium]
MKSILFSKSKKPALKIFTCLFCTLMVVILLTLPDNSFGMQKQKRVANQPTPSSAATASPKTSLDVSQFSDLKTFWSLTKLGGGIALVIFLVLGLGIFLIILQIYELMIDKFKGRVLLSVDYRQHTINEMSGLVQKYPNNLTARLYSILLSIFHSTGNTRDFHDEIANYIQLQQDRFATFKGRLAFLSDTAGALGLLGTVWGMFVTFFGGNLDSQRILNGMGLALVTTLIGLVVSIILNFFSTEVFSIFNKRLDIIASKADEFRLWLMAIVHQRNKKNNSGGSQPNNGPERKSSSQQETFTATLNESVINSLSLKAISEFKQDGFIGHKLNEPIAIFVETAQGRKVAGVPIRFEVAEGNGVLANKNQVAWVKTDKKGLAKMDWFLGHQVAPQKLKVSIANNTQGALEFVSFARPYIADELKSGVPARQNSGLNQRMSS